ncbi:hypothetical protein MtrunA17_Chr6g0476531 [Medicago truncatula]|uniref:Transmembrane protein n=1 Tax=Medicago truncatula TaxID=3880 RepID=A0A396HLD7_MEDTR|nr:hypothetical protein MtrunA17_Chr6g0476531 [Medicago truncatula]
MIFTSILFFILCFHREVVCLSCFVYVFVRFRLTDQLRSTLLETLSLPADFPKEINPQEFLPILLFLLLWTCFMRSLSPHENLQVTKTFALVSPAEVFLFSFFVFFHESLGNSPDIPADFRMFFLTDFAAFLFIFFFLQF